MKTKSFTWFESIFKHLKIMHLYIIINLCVKNFVYMSILI